jgi:hypothetical protein
MDNILMLISVLCFAKTSIMHSLLPLPRYKFIFGLLCVLAVWFTYPYAIETNKINLEAALMQQDKMMDMTLFLVIDLLLSIGFCAVVFARWNKQNIKKRLRLLAYIPSLLIFPVIFYLQINLSFLFVGVSFFYLTASYAAFVFVFIVAGSYCIKKLVPETVIRLELIMLFSGLLFALMICCTVFHPSARILSQSSSPNFKELVFSLSVIACIFTIGMVTPKIYNHFKK